MRIWLSLFVLIVSLSAFAQQGGKSVFQSLSLTPSAKIASLGGQQITSTDSDINYGIVNPSALSNELDKNIALNYVSYFSDIKYSNFSIVKQIKGYGIASGTINYLSYGNFTRTDELGNNLGSFNASDFNLQIGAAKNLDSLFSVGVNVKYANSRFDDLKSNAIAMDAGVTYYSVNKLFSSSFLIKNAGVQIKKYTNSREKLPIDIQIGLTKKLAHAPFRLSLLLHNLQAPDLSHINSNLISTDPITDEVSIPNVSVGEKIMQHTIFGLEFIPAKAFNFRLGYNYRRRFELKSIDRTAMVGFSWGVGIKVAKLKIDYGRATYHLAGASNFISISKNLNVK